MLRVVVENVLYPITVEVLHKIFHRFGTVMKVITFNKNGKYSFQNAINDYNKEMFAKNFFSTLWKRMQQFNHSFVTLDGVQQARRSASQLKNLLWHML